MAQVRGKLLLELQKLLRQARLQRARPTQCQESRYRPAMVETCELTSAGMGWAGVEAPLAYQAAEVVEMEVPTSLLDQFLNLWETLEKLGELCSRNYCKMPHHWACDCHSNDRTYQYSSLSPRYRAFFKRLLPRRVPF